MLGELGWEDGGRRYTNAWSYLHFAWNEIRSNAKSISHSNLIMHYLVARGQRLLGVGRAVKEWRSEGKNRPHASVTRLRAEQTTRTWLCISVFPSSVVCPSCFIRHISSLAHGCYGTWGRDVTKPRQGSVRWLQRGAERTAMTISLLSATRN